MASILDNLRRKTAPYGNAEALKTFQMPEEYGGNIPEAVLSEGTRADEGGMSKGALKAEQWVFSVLSARGQGKAFSENPTAKRLQTAFAAARRPPAFKNGSANQPIWAGSPRGSILAGIKNILTSNIALQGVNARYPAAPGSTGSGTAMLGALAAPTGGGTAMMQTANQGSALQAASMGVAAAMDAVSGDGSVYRNLAAASMGTAGGSAVVQVEMVNNNSISSELDLDLMVNYLADKVAEGLQSSAEAVHW